MAFIIKELFKISSKIAKTLS